MNNDAASSESIDRTLRVLWRHEVPLVASERGPRHKVTVDQVIDAAIRIADAGGLEAVSVRRVAQAVGLGAMSLYTYIPGRNELIGAIADQVMSEARLPRLSGDLRARLDEIAQVEWDELHRHPWLLDVDFTRPWVGPHSSARYEWQLAALEGMGLTDLEMDHTVAVVTGLAARAARTSVRAELAERDSGMTDAQWWEVTAPVLAQLMKDEDFPVASRVGSAAGEEYQSAYHPRRTLTFGLDHLAAGLESLLAER